MRFGAFVPQGFVLELAGVPPSLQWEKVHEAASHAERLGYESVWVYDHVHTFPAPSRHPLLEAFSIVAALAASTRSIRLGQLCTCNGFRSPAYLAKVTSTIDAISGGRLEVGIGAGWYQQEFDAYGYDFLSPAPRIAQLAESAQILKAMWTEHEARFHGRYYDVRGAINLPQPRQVPHPPLWIAGGGEQLTLRVVARYADYANFGRTPDEFARKKGVLHRHCEEVGRDPAEIKLTSNLGCFVAPTEREARARQDATRHRLLDLVDHRPLVPIEGGAFGTSLVGTPDMVADRLGRWVDLGCDYIVLQFWSEASDHESMDLFAEEVMPQLTAA